MFEPHEDKRQSEAAVDTARRSSILLYLAGVAVGWAVWFVAVRTWLLGGGDQHSEWVYFGSLLACLLASLFVVSVIGERRSSRRR